MTELPAPRPVDPLRLLLSLGAAIISITLIFAAVGYLFREPLLAFARWFVGELGGVGVALGFFIPDAFTVPLPNDAFSALGLAGGLPFVEVVAWSTGGSLAGGSVGFLIGRRLSLTGWYKRVMADRGAQVKVLIERHGSVGIALAALTPLPYSLASWAAGTSSLSYLRFLLISAPFRALRVGSVLWLISVGLWAIQP
jgi:membrane protein DedA with SNARE-associated domain